MYEFLLLPLSPARSQNFGVAVEDDIAGLGEAQLAQRVVVMAIVTRPPLEVL
jgi:hypothetical protein